MALGYPVPKFFFSISKPDDEFSNPTEIGFTEVSGLDYQLDIIEYRHGDDPNLSKIKMAGLRKFSNVTLKKGIIQGYKDANNDFYKWLGDGTHAKSVRTRKDYRRTVIITLKDEEANPVVAWTLINAFPVKVAFTDPTAMSVLTSTGILLLSLVTQIVILSSDSQTLPFIINGLILIQSNLPFLVLIVSVPMYLILKGNISLSINMSILYSCPILALE